MSGGVALAIAALGVLVAIALIAGVLVVQRAPGRVRVNLRRGLRRSDPFAFSVTVDVSEGWLTYVLLALLAWVATSQVAASGWVPHSETLVPLALAAVAWTVLLAKLAPRGTTYWLAVEVSAVAALFIATSSHASAFPLDFADWVQGISRSLPLALLVCMSGAVWLSVAWLSYWVIRRHRVPVGVAPLAIALAAEIINDPGQPGEYLRVAAWIILAVLLSLRLNVARLGKRWGELGVEQVSWSTSVEGGRALALLVAVAFLAPPLSTVDLSAQLFASHGRTEAAGGAAGPTPKSGSSLLPGFQQTGYTERVQPAGTLTRSHTPVMQVIPNTDRLVYWRGIDLYQVQDGAWYAGDPFSTNSRAANNAVVAADQGYLNREFVRAKVQVLGVASTTVFWPGEPQSVSVATQVHGKLPPGASGGQFQSVDGAYPQVTLQPGSSYDVVASISTATDVQLRAAGSDYPEWVKQISGLTTGRDTIDPRVAALATTVAGTATNDFDRVKAIETYLRGTFRYQLEIPTPPQGQDPVSYFLFNSKVGYCEYFASSMGEMVRSLHIPVRLVNGYGPGQSTLEQRVTANTIHASDAHTWVEVFFPRYGWVPFEPTPDPVYPAIDHGAATAPAPNPGVVPVAPPVRRPVVPVRTFDPRGLVPAFAAVGLLVALALAALMVRGGAALADFSGPWRRLGWLGGRLGVSRRRSETPLEFSHRLAGVLPEVGDEIVELGRGYSQSVYSRAGVPDEQQERLRLAWSRVRSRLLPTLVLGRRRGIAALVGLLPGVHH